MYKRKIKKVGEEMCLLFLCFITDFLVFSQDLINQGREKVVEATNSVAAARIQPLEDIISSIVSGMDNLGFRSGVGNVKHYQRKILLLQMVIQLMNCIINEYHFQLVVTCVPAVALSGI